PARRPGRTHSRPVGPQFPRRRRRRPTPLGVLEGEVPEMRVLLDLNVLLDLFLKRLPWVHDAAAIWTAHQNGQITAGIAASSLPTLHYLIQKGVDRATADAAVRDCLQGIAIWKIDAATINLACQQPGPDFEDNVQLA